jgi:hypothetical protein
VIGNPSLYRNVEFEWCYDNEMTHKCHKLYIKKSPKIPAVQGSFAFSGSIGLVTLRMPRGTMVCTKVVLSHAPFNMPSARCEEYLYRLDKGVSRPSNGHQEASQLPNAYEARQHAVFPNCQFWNERPTVFLPRELNPVCLLTTDSVS